jgi:hypothetical protein
VKRMTGLQERKRRLESQDCDLGSTLGAAIGKTAWAAEEVGR